MNRLKLADSGGKSTKSFINKVLCFVGLFICLFIVVGGLKELTAKLHPRRPLYGMCRVGKAQPHIAMILWVSSSSTQLNVKHSDYSPLTSVCVSQVGNEVDEYRRAECASHLPAIRAFFKV